MSGLKCKIGRKEISLSDIWIDEESFDEIGAEGVRELVQEDVNAFIEEIDLFNMCEFYWR